ncbi:MFS transporter [Sphingomonas sp. HF-S3]|uniref:MFS transporter n=1 Tax=Sphingomonas rustica TaxID=3103142 RepID=A0ABV0B507_9SPHN
MKVQKPGAATIIFICFLIAVFEGLDIQSMGVASPGLSRELGFSPGEMGILMSASTVGLMIGAALGGRLSDRYGRRSALLLSMLMLGLFSLATAKVSTFPILVTVRLLAGLGLGGAFPNLIALTSESAPPRYRATALSFMYCGLPIGGAAAGALLGFHGGAEWRAVFWAGGLGPLLLLIPIAFGLPAASSKAERTGGTVATSSESERDAKLLGTRSAITLRLWLAYFFTLLVVYLLLNWLPSLLVSQGFSGAEAARFALIMNGGAVVGSLVLGRLVDIGRPSIVLATAYSGMVAALLILSLGPNDALILGVFAAGFFVIGGQLVLYALGPMAYPPEILGAGVGAAVSVGRAGSVAGPLLAGLIISAGVAPALVPALAAPGLAVALIAGLGVLRRLPDERRG